MSLEYFCVLNSVQLVSGPELLGLPRYFSLMTISVIFLSPSLNNFFDCVGLWNVKNVNTCLIVESRAASFARIGML